MPRLAHYLSHFKDNWNPSTVAYLAALEQIEKVSPPIAEAIIQELKDQRSHLKLIASENYSSLAVQLAMGNLLTDKYAEGYAHHRFYAGCDNVDTIEEAAQQELLSIFGAEAANVQPHSGADANLLAFWTILVQKIQSTELEKLQKKTLEELTPEEYEKIRQQLVNQKVMGMSLNSGGHLTHGYRHNVSSKFMQAVLYDINPQTGLLDYSALSEMAKKEKPAILLAGYSAYPRKINFAKMREIADSVGAILMVDMAHFSGLVAGKAFVGEFDPVPYAHIVTSTTHKTLRGPRGGFVLGKKEFAETLNKGCPLLLGGPLPHVLAAKAIAFKEANTSDFRQYAQKIVENAQALAEGLMALGAKLLTNGTENHLMIIDVSPYGLTGRQAETLLRDAYLTVNRNAIPFDKNGPWYTSGVRIGSPAVTTLGMGVSEMKLIAEMIVAVLKNAKAENVVKTGQVSKAKATVDAKTLESVRKQVHQLLTHFPLYPELKLDA